MAEELNMQKIEAKWQKKWEKEKIFEANPNNKKKFFINFPYPYLNGYLHLGHAFSSVRVDVMARYKRMQGFNVLFPQGWHYTGTPVWAAAQRIKEKEPKQIKMMKAMGFLDKDIGKFSDIQHWADVFVPAAKDDFSKLGNSIDWRRSFITTSMNPPYDKFVCWQFRKLKEKGLVVTGEHPVVWCPKDNMPIGDHDRGEGEGETTQDFIWIKFRMKNSDLILMAGTTRPDALYGQTNLWVDPKGDYVVVKVKDEKWVVGKEVVDKIKNQYCPEVKIVEKIDPKQLIGQWVKGPLVNNEIHILPAHFIKSNIGSGIVYSALEDPVDLYELKKIQSDKTYIKNFNLDEKEVKRLKPIFIIKVSGMEENLGESIGKEFGVKSDKDVNQLEVAKGELNKRVFRKGVMNSNCGICAGKSVPEAQIILKKKLVDEKDAIMFYELSGKVVCRCLTPAIVKVVSDQWYLKYGDKNWKKSTHKELDKMKLYPEAVRPQFNYVLDWLNDWACTHHHGAGTKLPWDNKWVIESLSDSTIYMAYYTISHLIKDIPEDKITDELFDYVFLGKGSGKKEWKKLKEEFEYWYPIDIRSSGKDLVQNHLSFCLFNHSAIFPEKQWPGGFSVNGWLLVNGEKMSKSKGNFFTIREMLEKYPADVIRANLMFGGEGIDDPNFDFSNVDLLIQKLKNWADFATTNYKTAKGSKEETNSDLIFQHHLNGCLKLGSEAMENMMFRTAFDKLFNQMQRALKDYINRGHTNQKVINDFIEIQTKVIAPFCPHITEEIWEKLGNKGFISLAKWPAADESKINPKFDQEEQIIEKVASDINNILKIVLEKQGVKKTKAYIYVLPNELNLYNESIDLIKKKTNLEITVFAVNDKSKYDPESKSGKTKPGKPAIHLE
ncbi:MAG: leucine--tRNA ligase [Candidatus ainarchaeum sp.]|nr:leucine--tRNA ligase [Candidatus ainarchaeum sp.]